MSKELAKAVAKGNLEEVKQLLRMPGININFMDLTKSTLLNIAISENHLEIASLLLTQPGIIVDLTSDGSTPMMMAVLNRSARAVTLLIPHSNLTLKDSINETAYAQAKRSHKFADTDKEKQEYQTVCTLLRNPTMLSAAEHGDLALLKTMLQNEGADVNARNHSGKTALMLAVSAGNLTMVEYLLTLPNIKVDLADSKGETSLLQSLKPIQTPSNPDHMAQYHQHISARLTIARLLVAFGANCNQRYAGNVGLTAVTAAVKWHASKGQECLNLLTDMINNNADLTVPCHRYRVERVNGEPISTRIADGTILNLIENAPRHVQASLKALIEPAYEDQLSKKSPPIQADSKPVAFVPLSQEKLGRFALLAPLAKTKEEITTIVDSVVRSHNDNEGTSSTDTELLSYFKAKIGYAIRGTTIVDIPTLWSEKQARAELAVHLAFRMLMTVEYAGNQPALQLCVSGTHTPMLARALKSFGVKQENIMLYEHPRTIPKVSFFDDPQCEAKITDRLANALKPALKRCREHNLRLTNTEIEQLIISARAKNGKQSSLARLSEIEDVINAQKPHPAFS